VTDLEIQRLLLDCGFKSAPPPLGARWALAGDGAGGRPLQVSCMPGARGGCVLLVPSEVERQLLVALLQAHDVHSADVRAERMEARAPWLMVGVGVGALALFGWVLSTIRPFFP
jgi:hypothetical protein